MRDQPTADSSSHPDPAAADPRPRRSPDSLPFTAEEYAARLEATRRAMHAQRLDALVVTAPDNAYYLTGYDSLGYYQFQAMVISAAERAPWGVLHQVEAGSVQLSSWVEDISFWRHDRSPDGPALLAARLLAEPTLPRRVGVDLDGSSMSITQFEQLRAAMPGTEFVNASRLLPELRAVKSPAEVEYLRAAAALADLGVTAAADAATIGATEFEIKAAADVAMTRAGSEFACLPAMISSGPKTLAVHQSAGPRVVEDGDPITVGLAGCVRRYNSNILRTFLPRGSRPNPHLEEAYALLVHAFERCLSLAGPGVPGSVLDQESRRVTRDLDRYRLHRTGYGLEAGYPPSWMGAVSLSSSDPVVLAPGMVVTIEPTFIFFDRVGAQRFSAIYGNNVLITEDGAQVLNQVPDRLDR